VSAVADLVRGLVADGLLAGAHDIADGGLAGSLGELVARSGLGVNVGVHDEGELFSEASGRVVVCVAPDRVEEVVARAGVVTVTDIGGVGGDRLVVDGLVDLSVGEVTSAFRDTLPAAMAAGATH
jgi:phosphoribosylformylglycinamidine synthase